MRRVPLHKLLWPYLAFLVAATALAVMSAGLSAEARAVRGGTAQGVHAGGHHSANRAAPHSSVQSGSNRAQTRATPHRDAAQSRTANQNRSANRNTNVSRNTNVNRNTNISNDINIDVDDGWDNDWGDHPIAAGVAVGTAAAVTAAAIGSVVHSVPPSCVNVVRYGVTYYQCGSTWYEPQYAGSSVTYVVIDEP